MKRTGKKLIVLSTAIFSAMNLWWYVQGDVWADNQTDKWVAERKAVTAFGEELNSALVNGATFKSNVAAKEAKKVNLAEIGTSYTANQIDPLGEKDFSLAGYTLGQVASLHKEPYNYDESISIELNPIREAKEPHITLKDSNSANLLKKQIDTRIKAGNDKPVKNGKDEEVKTEKEGNDSQNIEILEKDKKAKDSEGKRDIVGETKKITTSSDGVMLTQELPQVKGYFTTYTGSDGYYTVYTGPLENRVDALRKQGLRYHYYAHVITAIHVESSSYVTSRGISVGSSRGEVLFSYGIPTMLWRNAKTNSLIMLYEGKVGNNTYYQSFTIENNKVSYIDYFDKQVMPSFEFPDTKPLYLQAGIMKAEDFKMMGYEINKPFVEASDDKWQAKGTLYNDDFSSYDGFLVSYDKHNLVSRVLLSRQTGVTRRGVSIGDTKYLMLFLYGQPTFVEDGINEGAVKSKAYGYKNPDNNSYLLFTVENDQDFITTVMLSDRTISELEHTKVKKQEGEKHE